MPCSKGSLSWNLTDEQRKCEFPEDAIGPCRRCRRSGLNCELFVSRRGRKRGTKIRRRSPSQNVQVPLTPKISENQGVDAINTPLPFPVTSHDSILDMFFNPRPDSNLLSFPFPNLGDMTESFYFDNTGCSTNAVPPPVSFIESPLQITPKSTTFEDAAYSDAGIQSLIELEIISDRESRDLIGLYWTDCHTRGPLLDPDLHTYEFLSTHTFLFNCICAVAAKFYRYKFGLAERIVEIVTSQLQHIIFNERPKIETAQGLFLLAHWHGRGTNNYSRTVMIANTVCLNVAGSDV